MLATCDAYRAHRHGSESPHPGSEPSCNHLAPTNNTNIHTCHKRKIARRTATLSSHLAHVHKDKRGSHKLAW